MLTHTDLNLIAMIGIILLIGIVKKNAIMMIDFALAAERNEAHESSRSDLSSLPVAFPADPDDHHGRAARRASAGARNGDRSELRRPLGITIIGGLIVSQLLTLYTTPVVYLVLDRHADSRAALRQEVPYDENVPNDAKLDRQSEKRKTIELTLRIGISDLLGL